MSVEEIGKEICAAAKERKENLTRTLRKHQINPRTFYDWSSGKTLPSEPNLEKLYRLFAEYTEQQGRREAA